MTQNKYILEPCIYSEPLIARIHELNKIAIEYKCDMVDVGFIEKGLSFAKYYHNGQFRKSGEPYVSHPIAVAEMVANEKFKEDVIIAALLHDTIEDTTLTLSEIETEFSPRIAQMVDRLTRKIDPVTCKKISAGECLLKALFLGDDDVVLIKMFDRLHNISTIKNLSKEKQIKIANETEDIFNPIGMYKEYDIFCNKNIIFSEDTLSLLSLVFQNALNQNDKKLVLVS